MSLQYHYWQADTPGPPYNRASPNLMSLLHFLLAFFGGSMLGCYVVRRQRSNSGYGTKWSTHAFGAALDWGYTDRKMALRVIDWLIANYEVLGVQMIVDEGYGRTWLCDRGGVPGWKAGGNGGNWLHLETTPDRWADATPVADRLTPAPAPPKEDEEMLSRIRVNDDIAELLLDGSEVTWIPDGNVAAALAAVPGVVTPGVVVVGRLFLKALILNGGAPTTAAYATADAAHPGRTVAGDFASHRP